jgi:rod shape-determining protein MreC
LGGVFPKGLPVGTVSEIKESRRGMFQQIEIASSVDFSQLEYLIVIMKKSSLTGD